MLLELLQILMVLFLAVVFHEYAHGWVAHRLGDPTAQQAGRLTLNPLKHIDPIGMIVVPLVLKILHFKFVIGWAKPVPVNFANLHNPRRDMIWVALAGPLTNFVLAFLLSRLLILAPTHFIYETIALAVLINLILGFFNLIPIPPLDGSRVVMGLLPIRMGRRLAQVEPYGFLILLVLLNLGFFNFLWALALLTAVLLNVNMNVL